MPHAYVPILVLSLLSVLTTAAGVLLARLIRDKPKVVACGIGFSAGIMILVSALELLPEAWRDIGPADTMLATGSGAALLWLVNLVIPHSHLVREHGLADTRVVRSVYLVVIGLILHDVPEGVAMANAYVAEPSLGVLVGLAVALHNLAEEMAMAVPAMALRSQRFLLWAAALSALAEPAGAMIGLMAAEIVPRLNAHFLGFAAGAMIFISLHELVPMARRYGNLGWFASGIALSLIVHRLLALLVAA